MARILLSDGRPDERDYVRSVLDGAGYVTDAVGSLKEAVQFLLQNSYDLILVREEWGFGLNPEREVAKDSFRGDRERMQRVRSKMANVPLLYLGDKDSFEATACRLCGHDPLETRPPAFPERSELLQKVSASVPH